MRVTYASSQPAAIRRAVSSSSAIASGTLAVTPVALELSGQPHRGRCERCKVDRNRLFGRRAEPERSDALSLQWQASAVEQRPDRPERGPPAFLPLPPPPALA